MIRIVVDGAPVAKGRGRVGRMGNGAVRVFTPSATRRYEDVIRAVAAGEMNGRPPLDEALALTVTSYVPIPRSWSLKKQKAARDGLIRPTVKPDWDNVGKITDALKTIVWRDDALVVDAHVHKHYSDRPRLEIVVEPIG